MGARDGFPFDEHMEIFTIDLDKTTYFWEARSSSNSDDLEEIESITRSRLDDLPIDQEQSKLLMEGTKEINIGDANNVHKIHLAQSLNPLEKEKFIQFFKQRPINFVWSYVDMLGLDPELVLHHLPLLPRTNPYKKKLRKMHPQITLLVKIELQKLLDVGFIGPIDYVEWISNLVLVTKNTGASKSALTSDE